MTVAAISIVGPASVIRNDYSHRKYLLANPMSIRGRVVDGNGQAIAGFIVQVQNDRTVGLMRVATAGDGTFRIDDLPCGEECLLSGWSSSQPKHSLLKRRFACALRQELNFGDLIAIPSTPLAVRIVPAAGKTIPPDLRFESDRLASRSQQTAISYFPRWVQDRRMKITGRCPLLAPCRRCKKLSAPRSPSTARLTELVEVHLE